MPEVKKVDLKVTEPTDAQVQLLKALECENTVTKKFIKKVLKKAEKLVLYRIFFSKRL